MTVRIKIIVDPPAGKEIKFGYRHQTFFIKLPDRLYEELLTICVDRGIDFQTFFTECLDNAIKQEALRGND
ncbi:MAG: hypothetical protein WCQ50_21925 [Spirochaetota bacterium]